MLNNTIAYFTSTTVMEEISGDSLWEFKALEFNASIPLHFDEKAMR